MPGDQRLPARDPDEAGPETLASVMILAAETRPFRLGLALVLTMAAFVFLLGSLALLLAAPIGKLLGQTGVNVVRRVRGLVLAALALQYVADGARGLVTGS